MTLSHIKQLNLRLPITKEDRKLGFRGELVRRSNAVIAPYGPGKKKLQKSHIHVYSPETHEAIFKGLNVHVQSLTELNIEKPPEATAYLKGHYIFGGMTRIHFGHFLLECTSHLWAIDHVDEPIDGILFYPLYGVPIAEAGEDSRRYQFTRKILDALQVKHKLHIVNETTQVEKLTIGERALGTGKRSAGSSYYRKFMRSRNAATNNSLSKNHTSEKTYISRTKLSPHLGSILGEDALERTFRDAGFRIFHPQDHSVDEQMDVYKNSEIIVGSEGSALHLPPFCINADTCKVVIIARQFKQDRLKRDFCSQYIGFTGIDPIIIDARKYCWKKTNTVFLRDAKIVVDFEEMYRQLQELDILPAHGTRYFPDIVETTSHVMALSQKYKGDIELMAWEK